MSNKPFNQQITNALERPTSSGLNLGFANYDVQALALSLLQSGIAAPGQGTDGFVGASFYVTQGPTPTQVYLGRGVGFVSGAFAPISNIGGIAGVNDAFDYKALYTDARTLDVAPLCSAGNIRRDLIMIKPKTTLTDVATTDIYQPGVNAFSAQNRYHTLSRDFTNEPQYTLPAGGVPTADQYLVYKMGIEVPAASPNGFLDAPLPVVDAGYYAIAAINVADTLPGAGYTTLEINDLRKILAPFGLVSFSGKAKLGSTPSGPSYLVGDHLSNVTLNSMLTMPVSIVKDNDSNTQNKYKLIIVHGGSDLRVGGTINVRNDLLIDAANFSLGASASIVEVYNGTATAATQALLLNSAQASPTFPLAVGQGVTVVTFVLGMPEYYASSPYTTKMLWNTTHPVFSRSGGTSVPTVDVDFNLAITFV